MAVPAEMAKTEGGDASTIRIYVGGLGESVTAEDLKKTFSTPQLGKVESMDIVRTKGRSFAYLDLLPSSDKSLAKLFSTYNGCMWKGGRLRIEKAKEHFFRRLKREWEEDVALATTSAHLPDTEEDVRLATTAAEMAKSLKYQKKGSKMDEMQLRMYFPKLGKLKSVPFRGTGKHKYSFQRVEVPSLPIHFCDCEEHSGPPDTTKDSKNVGMDEKELNIMNSVLNKIFERENYFEQAPRDFKSSKVVRGSKVTVDHLKNDENLVNQEMEDDDNLILNVVAGANDRTTVLKDPTHEAMTATQDNENFVDQEMDEDDDNLIINVVAGANDKNTMFKDPTQEAITAIQSSLSKESRLATDKQRQGSKISSNRKRKAPSEKEDGEAHTLPSKPEAKRKAHSGNSNATFPKKSPWKDLVSASSGATFSVSDILPSAIPGKEMRSGSEGVSVSFSDKKDEKVSYQHDNKDLVSASRGATSNVLDILPSAIPGKEMQSGSEGVSVSFSDKKDEKVSDQHDKKDLVSASSGAMFSVSDILPSAIPGKERQSGSEGVGEKDEKVSNQHEVLGKVAEDSTDNVDAPVDLYARGAAWRQKLSWTELVRDTTRSSFSISQTFPGLSYPKPELAVMGETVKMQKSSSTGRSDLQYISTSEEGTKADALSVPGTSSGGTIVEEQKNVHLSKELPHLDNYQPKGEVMNEAVAPTPEKKHLSAPKQAFVEDTSFSDTCSFMRSAASMKEWTKTKAALSGSLKKKANEKK